MTTTFIANGAPIAEEVMKQAMRLYLESAGALSFTRCLELARQGNAARFSEGARYTFSEGDEMAKPKSVEMAEQAIAKGHQIVFFGESKTPIGAESIVFSQQVRGRVSEMRKAGRTEPEHELMREAAAQLCQEM